MAKMIFGKKVLENLETIKIALKPGSTTAKIRQPIVNLPDVDLSHLLIDCPTAKKALLDTKVYLKIKNEDHFVQTTFDYIDNVNLPVEEAFFISQFKKRGGVFLLCLDFDKTDPLANFIIPSHLKHSMFLFKSRSGRTKLAIAVLKDRFIDADKLAERFCALLKLPFAELDKSYGARINASFYNNLHKFLKGDIIPFSAKAILQQTDGGKALAENINRNLQRIENTKEFFFLSYPAKVVLAGYLSSKKHFFTHEMFTAITGMTHKTFYAARKSLIRLGILQKISDYKFKRYCAKFIVAEKFQAVISRSAINSKASALAYIRSALLDLARPGSFNEFEWKSATVLHKYMTEQEFLEWLSSIPSWSSKRDRLKRAALTYRWAKRTARQ